MENEQETFARIIALATNGRCVLVKRDRMIDAAFDAAKSLALTDDTYTDEDLADWEQQALDDPRMQTVINILRAAAMAYASVDTSVDPA